MNKSAPGDPSYSQPSALTLTPDMACNIRKNCHGLLTRAVYVTALLSLHLTGQKNSSPSPAGLLHPATPCHALPSHSPLSPQESQPRAPWLILTQRRTSRRLPPRRPRLATNHLQRSCARSRTQPPSPAPRSGREKLAPLHSRGETATPKAAPHTRFNLNSNNS